MFGNNQNHYCVYILGNYKRNVLYIGVTGNLVERVFEHKKEVVKGFTARYKVHDLLYYEIYETPTEAIGREKQLKRWSRIKKDILISKANPSLKDLYPNII